MLKPKHLIDSINNMRNLFVKFEIALKLKDIGFDEKCLMKWKAESNDKFEMYYDEDGYWNSENESFVICSAPLYQQCIDWFRNKHNLIIEIQTDQTSNPKFCYEIYKYKEYGNWTRLTDVNNWGLSYDYYRNINDAIEETIKLIN